MRRAGRLVATAVVGGLLLAVPAPVRAQAPATRIAAPSGTSSTRGDRAAPGSLDGSVWDERGRPLSGVVVTAVGAATSFAVTNDRGRFAIAALPAGSYLVHVVADGYPPRARRVTVRSASRATSLFALRRTGDRSPLLAAGVGAAAGSVPEAGESNNEPAEPATAGAEPVESETAWRVRHARRGVLRDAAYPLDLLVDEPEPGTVIDVVGDVVGRAVSSPARAASSFFAGTPFTGQVHFLTSSVFESPEQLFTTSNLSRGTAYVKISAPAGAGEWTARGALSQADLASWIVAGTYRTLEARRHRYHTGLSYSTQAYGGGHPLALREVTNGSRNAGELFGFDTFTLSPQVSVTYGARYQHYDYLEKRGLFSPSLTATASPSHSMRLSVSLSSRGDAPGAGEFLQPNDEGIWLPPQRTFSAADPGTPFRASRTQQIAGELEQDLGVSTVSIRAFGQRVDNQLITVFGAELPGYAGSRLGHYFVGSAGQSQATGLAAAIRASLGRRVRGSVAYSLASAQLAPDPASRYVLLLAPVATRPATERLHDVRTSFDADVPETATKVVVVYRVGNGYARLTGSSAANEPATRIDSRFDVQVRQSLPFLNFNNARWEMLVAVRNFLRDAELDQSIFDELLAVRPPKRIVGGVTLHF